MLIVIASFGFKHGKPGDADFIADARSLPNPWREPLLRDLTGEDVMVQRWIRAQKQFPGFVDACARQALRGAKATDKAHYALAVGCTGGKHRSVVAALDIWQRVFDQMPEGWDLKLVHRDLWRDETQQGVHPPPPSKKQFNSGQ